MFSDAVDPVQIGRDALDYWSETIANFTRERDRLPPERICDLHYDDIRHDPIGAIRRIYEFFGWSLSREAEQRMRIVLKNQPRELNGCHRYDPSQFGLEAAQGSKVFAAYWEVWSSRPADERFGLSSPSVQAKSREGLPTNSLSG